MNENDKQAQPVQPAGAQEPVAWANYLPNGLMVGLSDDPDCVDRFANPVPLYTAPPAVAVNEQLADSLKKANDQAEHFEREWHLRGDEIEVLKAQPVRPAVNDEATKWKAIAEFMFAQRVYPDQLELGQGALDDWAKKWTSYEDAIAAAEAEKAKGGE